MSIIIGADLVPTDKNLPFFKDENVLNLFDDKLSNIVSKADYRIFNLETPLSDTLSPISKCGPALSAPIYCVCGFSKMNVDLFTLANNHIMDQGVDGLRSTISALRKNNISYVGAGENLSEAKKAHIFSCNGKTVGVYACAEHEFSIAMENVPGANPFNPLESLEHIESLKTQSDYVIVLYHGGKEYYRYPSPELQRVCRKIVEKGADLVICQHSHCIGCEENYQNGKIVYGQGNFLFDLSENEFWANGLLIELDDNLQVIYHPIIKNGEKVRSASPSEANQILEAFKNRSNEILDEAFVVSKYRNLADEKINHYILLMLGLKYNFLFRAVNKLSGHRLERYLIRRKYLPKKREVLINMLECEAHRELILQGLKNDM